MSNKFVDKILKNNDKYIIFYSDWCTYSNDAIALLNKANVPYKGYKIENLGVDKKVFLDKLKEGKDMISYDPSHTTRPLIFKYGKFLGGYNELMRDIKI